jgi:diguanylate cyclase (GGDEF)-like protein
MLDDESISRRHAAIQRTEHGFLLVDLNSTNGTFVNGQRVSTHALQAGDQIHVGSHILKYLSHDNIERQYFETVYAMTTTDGLTNAHNKQYLCDMLKRELQRAKRYMRPLSVVMMDIDHFKQVNDAHGHLTGDEVLQEFGRRVREWTQADDLFARFGGEEFTLVLNECDMEDAVAHAERIRKVIAESPFTTHLAALPISASFGVGTTRGGRETTIDELLNLADMQLYRSKRAGRNCVSAARLA